LSKGIVEMFCAANEYDRSRLQGGAESIGAEGLFREVETLHGTCPILLDNATGVAERARAIGVDITLSIRRGQQHVYPSLAGRSAVVAEEFEKLAAWYGE
jgi:acetyl esterase/lipase